MLPADAPVPNVSYCFWQCKKRQPVRWFWLYSGQEEGCLFLQWWEPQIVVKALGNRHFNANFLSKSVWCFFVNELNLLLEDFLAEMFAEHHPWVLVTLLQGSDDPNINLESIRGFSNLDARTILYYTFLFGGKSGILILVGFNIVSKYIW